ncbi:hypothetical protein, partial [Burkholderia thailandensis]|uniref:hypothetical protein n=1 Tax=Burkholderia thailandensis TaxID=57975 RepID=UPI0021C96653
MIARAVARGRLAGGHRVGRGCPRAGARGAARSVQALRRAGAADGHARRAIAPPAGLSTPCAAFASDFPGRFAGPAAHAGRAIGEAFVDSPQRRAGGRAMPLSGSRAYPFRLARRARRGTRV